MCRFAVVPLQSTQFQHADERNQEGRRDNKAPASSPFALPVYALIYLLISGGADTGVIPSTSAYFISSPRDRSNSLCRRKKKGNATGAISISIRVTNVFLSRLFWGPFFLFFPLKFLSSTLLPYVLSIFGRRRGSPHNALGPPVVVFRVSSPPARAVPFFRIERIMIIIFFFSPNHSLVEGRRVSCARQTWLSRAANRAFALPALTLPAVGKDRIYSPISGSAAIDIAALFDNNAEAQFTKRDNYEQNNNPRPLFLKLLVPIRSRASEKGLAPCSGPMTVSWGNTNAAAGIKSYLRCSLLDVYIFFLFFFFPVTRVVSFARLLVSSMFFSRK